MLEIADTLGTENTCPTGQVERPCIHLAGHLGNVGLSGKSAIHAPIGISAQNLDVAVERAEGLLNMHSFEREYLDYPRVLEALVSRRAMWSEPFASPVAEGVHYLVPQFRPTEEEVARVQRYGSQLLCRQTSLWPFF